MPVSYVHSHENRISNILFPNVKYKDLCATINPSSKPKILRIKKVKILNQKKLVFLLIEET